MMQKALKYVVPIVESLVPIWGKLLARLLLVHGAVWTMFQVGQQTRRLLMMLKLKPSPAKTVDTYDECRFSYTPA